MSLTLADFQQLSDKAEELGRVKEHQRIMKQINGFIDTIELEGRKLSDPSEQFVLRQVIKGLDGLRSVVSTKTQ